MAGADRHIVILADEIDYSVVEIQCRDHLRILFDKVADQWRTTPLAQGNGPRHIQPPSRPPLTVAPPHSLTPFLSDYLPLWHSFFIPFSFSFFPFLFTFLPFSS